MTKEAKNKLFVLSTLTGIRVCVLFFEQGQLVNDRIDLNYEFYNRFNINTKDFMAHINKYNVSEIMIAHNSREPSLQPKQIELNSKQHYSKLLEKKGIKSRFFVVESNNLSGGTAVSKLNFQEY